MEGDKELEAKLQYLKNWAEQLSFEEENENGKETE